MNFNSFEIIKKDKDKSIQLTNFLGDYVKYLYIYNPKAFHDCTKKYNVLLSSKGETIIFNYSKKFFAPYCDCPIGAPHTQETFVESYYNKFKEEVIDTNKKWYLNKLRSRVDFNKFYYILDDRELPSYRELSEEEKEGIKLYQEWYNRQIKRYAKSYFKMKEKEIFFMEEEGK